MTVPTLPDPRQPVPEGGEIETRPIQGWIRNSFKSQIDDLRRTASRARGRFKPGSELHSIHQPDMEAYAAACDAAADVFAARVSEPVGSVSVSASAEPSGDRTGAQRKGQSSPRSQPVTAKEAHKFVAFGIDDPRYYADICAKCGDIHEPQPVTSASIEEAIANLERLRKTPVGDDAETRFLLSEYRKFTDALITAVRQGQ